MLNFAFSGTEVLLGGGLLVLLVLGIIVVNIQPLTELYGSQI